MRTLIGKEMKLDFSKSALQEIAISAEIRGNILRNHASSSRHDAGDTAYAGRLDRDADQFLALANAIRTIWPD